MKETYIDYEVIENREISNGVFELLVRPEDGASFLAPKAGQFYMIKCGGKKITDPLLSRPISICDFEGKNLRFLYLKKGKGTILLSEKNPGDKLQMLGALGTGFDTKLAGKIALLGGGIGIAPLYFLAKNLKNSKIDTYLGYADKPYFAEEFEKVSNSLTIYTESGNAGKKGFVTRDFKPENYDYIFSCGPTPMLKALYNITEDKSKLYLSLEKRMACGMGACLGCVCKTEGGMKTVCKTGPVFRADELEEDF